MQDQTHSPEAGAAEDAPPEGGSVILKPVFLPAAAVIIGLIAVVIIFRDRAEDLTSTLNTAISDGVGWWYVIAVNVFLVFALYCAFSKVGRIRLGRDDERPEFSVLSWFMMLFSAGMGIGLVFFGVAEPLSNFVLPAESFGNEPRSTGAAQDSVGVMMLQWGLHPWGIYAVVGLGIAYMTFRRGRPLAIRWLLEPLIGRQRVEGWMGHTIDVVAIVGTLFGIATSFGFGVSQIMAGLEYLGVAERSTTLIVAVIAVVTAIALWSVVSGVHKGLKWLSNFNMGVAALLALAVFVLGPTILILQSIPDNAGSYLSQLPQTALNTGPWSSDNWETIWTIGYWGWWTSWAPFVGMFIARISRGRTIRQFIIGVLAAPTLASLVWFTVFGASGIHFTREGLMQTGDEINSDTSLFEMFGLLPLGAVLSAVAIMVVVFFFVTSSDSGSLVIDMMACGGRVDTPKSTRIFWAVLEGVAAAVLLVVGGDAALTALQTLAVSTAAPFSVILVLACVAMYRAFRHDVATMPDYVQLMPSSTEPGTHESLATQARRHLREMRGISMTLGGLSSTPGTLSVSTEDAQIVPYRRVSASEMTFDTESGEPELVVAGRDPLAGEVFDTEEFAASQEYVDLGGEEPSAEPADASEGGADRG